MMRPLPSLRTRPHAGLLAALLVAACNGPVQQPFYDLEEDASGPDTDALPPPSDADDASTDAPPTPDAALPDDVTPEDVEPPPPVYDGVPSFVEVQLTPARAIYAPSTTVQLAGVVYDAEGAPMNGVELVWTTVPDAAATPGEDAGTWTLDAEGTVRFRACVRYPTDPRRIPCGERVIVVDGAPPTIALTRPLPGAMLSGEDDALIRVNGRVIDTNGNLEVFVNGKRVVVGREGLFSAEITPVFGINHIDVIASDGLQTIEGRAALDVLWAPDYLPVDRVETTPGEVEHTLSLDDALSLQLRQGFLDDGEPFVLDPDAESVVLTDLASVLELIVAGVDPSAFLPDPVVDSSEISLRVTSLDLGPSTVSIAVSDRGLTLFVALPEIVALTEGYVDIGVPLDLDGGLTASIAAGISLRVERLGRDQPLVVELDEVLLALEDATGFFASEEANGILEVVEGLLFRTVEGFIVDAVRDAYISAIPPVLEDAIQSIEDLLGEQRFTLDLDFGEPAELLLRGTLDRVIPTRARHLTASLALTVGATGEAAFPTARGVAIDQPIDRPGRPFSDGSITVHVKLPVLNGLLFSLWNTGFIDLDLSEQLPAEVSVLIQGARAFAQLPPVITRPGPERAQWDLQVAIGQLELIFERRGQEDRYGLTLVTGLNVRVEDDALRVELEAVPDVEVWLIETSGDRPIFSDTGALEGLITGFVWGELTEAIVGGLVVPLPAIAVEEAATFAPLLEDLVFQVTLARPPEIRSGFAHIYGGLEGRATLRAGEVGP
jgi:hypothetical protein